MEFTYKAYENLITSLHNNGYKIRDYHDYMDSHKCAILRHDIDYDLQKAIPFARLEKENNAKSTYFVLVTSDFYNPASKSSLKIFDEIRKNGHEIGLHFDEVRYLENGHQWNEEKTIANILKEATLLSSILGEPVKSVSMHRPSKYTLESNLEIPGLVNSYAKEFFNDFKYVSDSRMRWREDVDSIILSNEYNRMHILTHAFWYYDDKKSMKDIVLEFVNGANNQRYGNLKDNITDLENIISKSNDV